jgi:hypothetical protein
MRCQWCHREFSASARTAKWCSTRCRQAAYRARWNATQRELSADELDRLIALPAPGGAQRLAGRVECRRDR